LLLCHPRAKPHPLQRGEQTPDTELTPARAPLLWAEAQRNLGVALAILGEREKQPDVLKQALEASRAAQEVYRNAGMVQDEADLTNRIEALEAEIAAADMP
jgi:hypothetical protein